MKRLVVVSVLAIGVMALAGAAPAGAAPAGHAHMSATTLRSAAFSQIRKDEYAHETFCEERQGFCTDLPSHITPGGEYYGHDEPSVEFTSSRPGSGNSLTYTFRLPADPKTLPKQNGNGTTWSFQLRATNWFGLALCDNQSAPEGNRVCKADSNWNNFTSTNPNSPRYLGKHPGTAYMELQFYPPAYVEQFNGDGCTATQYCAAMTIDSFQLNQNTNVYNTSACNSYFLAGVEPVNWAYVTKNGVAQAPANPIALSTDPKLTGLTPNPGKDLMMNPGDMVRVYMHDTPAGFQVNLTDLTTGGTGSMTASTANGFGHILYTPKSKTCHEAPYAFHPQYSTAVSRGAVWTAHTYDVAYSDEIGHWEYCGSISQEGGNCTSGGATDRKVDSDDVGCFDGAASTLIQITGCYGEDLDFDGPGYLPNWPGTIANVGLDQHQHTTPMLFTTPISHGAPLSGAAFETDLPAFESTCNGLTGAGCTNPAAGMKFYPFFSTVRSGGGCVWEEGGRYLPGAINRFGGNSTTAFGKLLFIDFPVKGGVVRATDDFHRNLPANTCMP